jgi:hypothetical protein
MTMEYTQRHEHPADPDRDVRMACLTLAMGSPSVMGGDDAIEYAGKLTYFVLNGAPKPFVITPEMEAKERAYAEAAGIEYKPENITRIVEV